MKKSAVILAVAGLIQLALGLGLIGFTVMGQQKQDAVFYGEAGIISAEFSPVSSIIASGQYVQFEVTVDTQNLGECSAIFYWYRDGVLNQSSQHSGNIIYDGYVFVGSDVGTHTVEAVINVFPLDYSSYGDSVWCSGTVEVTSPSYSPTPIPTSSPSPSSYPSPTPSPSASPTSSPNPTSSPQPTSTPSPDEQIGQALMLILGLLFSISGAATLWLSRRF